MFNFSIKELWDIIKIGSGLLSGLIFGLISVVLVITSYKNRLEKSEETIALLKTIIFKEKEGLNVLTIAAHQKECEENTLMFSKDYSVILEKIESLEGNVEAIKNKLNDNKAEKHLDAVKVLVASINQKLSIAFSHDRRINLRNISDAEILSEKDNESL